MHHRSICFTSLILATWAHAAAAQWSYETVETVFVSDAFIATDSAGTPMILHTGAGNGTDDGRGALLFKVRVAPNTWAWPDAGAPTLFGVRPALAADSAGNAYVVFEDGWSGWTSLLKYRRTGPTSWVRDGNPVRLMEGYLDGYGPQIAVAPNGSIHVLVSRPVGPDRVIFATYAYNSGADWRTGWTSPFTAEGIPGNVAADSIGNVYATMINPPNGNNLNKNPIYVRLRDGVIVGGPTTLNDFGQETKDVWVAAFGDTAYVTATQWPSLDGSGIWNQWRWIITPTGYSGPVKVSHSGTSISPAKVIARSGVVRYYWRSSSPVTRFAYYLGDGTTDEWIMPGHDIGQADFTLDALGNLHGVVKDCCDTFRLAYGYKASGTPPTHPVIALSRQAFDYILWIGQPIPSEQITVTNVGTGTLNYTITSSAPWLSVQPAGGDATGQPGQFNVNYNLTGLKPGQHTGTLSLAAPGAANTPMTVTAYLTILTSRVDFDRDGDVDQSDFGHFQACLTGPTVPQHNPNCQDTKLDNDDDVDQYDLSMLQPCMSGAETPMPLNCGG